jgi:precorrin-6A/cobalt-precorrin-6A reductase
MNLLLLGGTADAKFLATGFHRQGITVIYSIAGLVRQPQLDCRVVSGGFSRLGGLDQFVEAQSIDAIVDATHPYAERMSNHAVAVARECRIPIWRYQRPAWNAQSSDSWKEFGDLQSLLPLLQPYRSVFFSAGQLHAEFVEQLHAQTGSSQQRHLLRTAKPVNFSLPPSMIWIEGIGPFDIDSERALFDHYAIDALVTKNSGGTATGAKLTVAQERGLPIFVLQRPSLAVTDREFAELGRCLNFVVAQAGETV